MEYRNNKKIAIFGSTPVEELFIRRLGNEGIKVDSFQSSQNPMIKKFANEIVDLTQISDDDLVKRLKEYEIIHLSTDESVVSKSDLLIKNQIPYIGGTRNQFRFEEDKSKIFETITENDILPKTEIVSSLDSIVHLKQNTPFVLKFVGDNGAFSNGNISSRVLFVNDLESKEAISFMKNSISKSNRVLVQEQIFGEEFSVNYFVDNNMNFFYMGSNVCYKRLKDGDEGPLCGGTGSYSIGGSAPFVNKEDLENILNTTKEFVAKLNLESEKNYTGALNLDLIKDISSKKVYLLEINCRRPGIHTSASLLGCLKTSLYEIYKHTNRGTLNSLESEFNELASIAVSAYPEYYPFTEPENLEEIEFNKSSSNVQTYFGWVEIKKETDEMMHLMLHSSNSVIFQYSGKNLDDARKIIYEEIRKKVPTLKYRKDIGDLKLNNY